MKRIETWDVHLSSEAIAASARPHVWGKSDCVMFAGRAVEVMTGEDLLSDIRGEYDSPLTAARLIKDRGFECLGDMVADRLPEIEVSDVWRGDLALMDGPYGEFLGVCVGHKAIAPMETGLIHVPMTQATRAFRVGERG